MKKYYRCLVVIEKTKTGFAAYSPDLDGCVAIGKTRTAVAKRIKEAIEFHLEGLKQGKLPIPKPYCYSSYLEITFLNFCPDVERPLAVKYNRA